MKLEQNIAKIEIVHEKSKQKRFFLNSRKCINKII